MDLAAMVPGMVPLLPNLRKLEWHIVRADSPFSLVFLFLSHNLRHLALEIDVTDVSPASFNHFLQHLPNRSPQLTHFNLYTQVVSRDIQTELSKCIKSLRSLKVVGLPPCYHTDVIVQALAVAPALVEMRTGWLAAQPPTPEESQVEFKEGWFRSVERVDLELSPLRAIPLITDPYRPRSLSRLRLTTGTLSDHDHLERFLSVVATTLPELKLLSLNLWGPHTPLPTAIPFNSFRPVLACRLIKTFEVGHNHPVQLDEADIGAMAEAWPNLAELTFCEDPVLTGNTSQGLSLSALPLFAEKFPALKELGLFLDGAPVPPFTAPPVFSNLIELNVGTSRLDSRHATANALYISDLCRNPVTIIKGKSAWHVSGVWDLEEDDTPYLSGSSAWADVGRTIKAVHTHRQEREKRRAEEAQRQATAITLAVQQLTKGVETVQGSDTLEAKVKELEAALRGQSRIPILFAECHYLPYAC